MEIRLILPEARQLFDAFSTVDKALCRMLHNSLYEVAEDNCDRFYVAYSRLKSFLYASRPKDSWLIKSDGVFRKSIKKNDRFQIRELSLDILTTVNRAIFNIM